MRRTQGIHRAHQAHPLVQRQGVACQCPAPARQRREAFTAWRVEPLDVCGIDDAVTLRAPSECLAACGRALDKAALGLDDATTLIAFDPVGAQDVAPWTKPRPPTRARVHGIAA